MVEQLICNQQVVSSSLTGGSLEASSSVGEHLVYTQAVVGSTPTLPIVYFGDKMIAGFVIGIFAGYLFAYIQVSLDNERKDD